MYSEYLDPMGLVDFGDEGRKVAGIGQNYCGFLSEATVDIFDIYLLHDTKIPTATKNILEAARAQEDRDVLVSYHINSGFKVDQEKALVEIFGSRLKNTLREHRDYVFGSLKRVVDSTRDVKIVYREVLRELRNGLLAILPWRPSFAFFIVV